MVFPVLFIICWHCPVHHEWWSIFSKSECHHQHLLHGWRISPQVAFVRASVGLSRPRINVVNVVNVVNGIHVGNVGNIGNILNRW
jgi:hypothetical protein